MKRLVTIIFAVALLLGFGVNAAVERVKQALGKVGSRAEELHFLAGLRG